MYIKTGSHGTIKRTVTAHVEPNEKAGTKSNVQHESNQNEPEARFNTRSLSIRIGQGIHHSPQASMGLASSKGFIPQLVRCLHHNEMH